MEITVSFLGIHKNGNQTFILDFHWPFIFCVQTKYYSYSSGVFRKNFHKNYQEMLFRKNSSLLLDLSSVSVVEHQQKEGEDEEEQAGRKGTK